MVCRRILVVGTGAVATGCIEYAARLGMNTAAVEPDQQGFSPVKATCKKNGCEYRLITGKEAVTDFLRSLSEPTLVVSAHNIYIFPEEIVLKPDLNIVNFHNALLPAHRGRNAPTWAIFEQDVISGVTWHQVTKAVDRGSVIAREETDIGTRTTAFELTRICAELGVEVFRHILCSLVKGDYCLTPQSGPPGCYHRSGEMPNDGILNLTWPTTRVSAFLRSLDYGKLPVFPPARVSIAGRNRAILGYELKPGECGLPGDGVPEVVLLGDSLLVRDGSGSISITLA
jgi:methionyl-tRNA formyltransferase